MAIHGMHLLSHLAIFITLTFHMLPLLYSHWPIRSSTFPRLDTKVRHAWFLRRSRHHISNDWIGNVPPACIGSVDLESVFHHCPSSSSSGKIGRTQVAPLVVRHDQTCFHDARPQIPGESQSRHYLFKRFHNARTDLIPRFFPLRSCNLRQTPSQKSCRVCWP